MLVQVKSKGPRDCTAPYAEQGAFKKCVLRDRVLVNVTEIGDAEADNRLLDETVGEGAK